MEVLSLFPRLVTFSIYRMKYLLMWKSIRGNVSVKNRNFGTLKFELFQNSYKYMYFTKKITSLKTYTRIYQILESHTFMIPYENVNSSITYVYIVYIKFKYIFQNEAEFFFCDENVICATTMCSFTFKLKQRYWMTESIVYARRTGKPEYTKLILDVHDYVSDPNIASMSVRNKIWVEISDEKIRRIFLICEIKQINIKADIETNILRTCP